MIIVNHSKEKGESLSMAAVVVRTSTEQNYLFAGRKSGIVCFLFCFVFVQFSFSNPFPPLRFFFFTSTPSNGETFFKILATLLVSIPKDQSLLYTYGRLRSQTSSSECESIPLKNVKNSIKQKRKARREGLERERLKGCVLRTRDFSFLCCHLRQRPMLLVIAEFTISTARWCWPGLSVNIEELDFLTENRSTCEALPSHERYTYI